MRPAGARRAAPSTRWAARGRESLGAIRAFRTWTVTSREELVGFRPGREFSYCSLSGLPITWHEDVVAARPGSGWLLEWFLRRFVQRCADGLARQAASLAADAAGR